MTTTTTITTDHEPMTEATDTALTQQQEALLMVAEAATWQIPLPKGVIEESTNQQGDAIALIYKYNDFVDEELMLMLTINKRCVQVFVNATMALACYHVARFTGQAALRRAIPKICTYVHRNYRNFSHFNLDQIHDLICEVSGEAVY